MAKTSAMNQIAVIQAEVGDVVGAKRTVSQISEEGEKGTAKVTVVCFVNGFPVYDCPPVYFPAPDCRQCGALVPNDQFIPWADARSGASQQPAQGSSPSPGWGGRDSRGNQYFLARDRAPDRVLLRAPADLPSDYLAADPQHGPVVDFVDDYDRHGTRITSRRYADGHAVIESLRPSDTR